MTSFVTPETPTSSRVRFPEAEAPSFARSFFTGFMTSSEEYFGGGGAARLPSAFFVGGMGVSSSLVGADNELALRWARRQPASRATEEGQT